MPNDSQAHVFGEVRKIIQEWIDAYPIEQFGDKLSGFEEASRLSEHMAKLGPYSVSRISGSMGRHMGKRLLEQVAELEKSLAEPS